MAYPWDDDNPAPTFVHQQFVAAAIMTEIIAAIEAVHEGAAAEDEELVATATKTSPFKWTVATGVTWSMAFHFATDGSTLPALWFKEGDVAEITEPDLVIPFLLPTEI